MAQTIDELLHGPSALPVLVKDDGTFATAAYPPPTLPGHAPESIDVDYDGEFEDGQILDQHERDAIESVGNGWTVVTGWSADPSLFIMRNDQYIGGELADHIRQTPGLWAVVSVEMHPRTCEDGDDGMPCAEWDANEECDHAEGGESEGVGWALVHQAPGAGDLYEKCAGCHLFIEPNADAGDGNAAYVHLDRGDESDGKITETHDAAPSGHRSTLDFWQKYGPEEMRARFDA